MDQRVPILGAILAATLACAAIVTAAPSGTKFMAVTWSDGAVHYLDRDLNDLGRFRPEVDTLNGMAVAGSTVFVGTAGAEFVSAHGADGDFRLSWADEQGANCLKGMTFVGGELAVMNGSRIQFHNPWSGELLRTIPSPVGGIEGIAWHPQQRVLYALGDVLYALDPKTGKVRHTLPNPARNDPYGGTALALIGRNRLLVGTNKGNWYMVDAQDGAVLKRGNNRLDMYGISQFGSLCSEDLTGDAHVDHRDILRIMERFGASGGRGDLDHSGTVDDGDIVRVLEQWGACP